MNTQRLDQATRNKILASQRNEITEHFLYKKLSHSVKDPESKKVLMRISEEELSHYNFWKGYTEEDVKPDTFKIWFFYAISRVLGLTFGIKLMEKGEDQASISYRDVARVISAAERIAEDEDKHEKMLIGLIDEERLRYVGSMVLGLNDALVELTGTLAGFTLALQNTRLIAMAGLITGIAAALSMASSEYLSTKSEESDKNPVKAAIYTGIVYILTVIFLILPFLILSNYYAALAFTVVNAIVVIIFFTYYISVARDIPFASRFTEMASISLGVALLSFGIGYLVRIVLGVDI